MSMELNEPISDVARLIHERRFDARITDMRYRTMTEQEKFLARLDTARANGLVDVKFLFHPSRAVKPEDIFAGLNEIEDSIKDGNCVCHSGWNGDEPA